MTFDAGEDTNRSQNALQYKSYAIPIPHSRQGDGYAQSPKKSKNESGFTNCLIAGNNSGYKVNLSKQNEIGRNSPFLNTQNGQQTTTHKRNAAMNSISKSSPLAAKMFSKTGRMDSDNDYSEVNRFSIKNLQARSSPTADF